MFEKSIIVAFIVLAIHATMQKDMIFGKVQDWLAPIPDSFKKPLYGCNVCMVPWYGTAAYWMIWGESVQEWVPVVLAAMGINYFISVFLPQTD